MSKKAQPKTAQKVKQKEVLRVSAKSLRDFTKQAKAFIKPWLSTGKGKGLTAGDVLGGVLYNPAHDAGLKNGFGDSQKIEGNFYDVSFWYDAPAGRFSFYAPLLLLSTPKLLTKTEPKAFALGDFCILSDKYQKTGGTFEVSGFIFEVVK